MFPPKRSQGEHFPGPGFQGLYLQTLRVRKSQGLYLQTLRVRKSQGLYLEILGSRGSSLACPLAPHPSPSPLASNRNNLRLEIAATNSKQKPTKLLIDTKTPIPGASVILSGRTLVAEVGRR
jgi:hypothetical protein